MKKLWLDNGQELNGMRTVYQADFIEGVLPIAPSGEWRVNSYTDWENYIHSKSVRLTPSNDLASFIEWRQRLNMDQDMIGFTFRPILSDCCVRIERRVAEGWCGFSSTAEFDSGVLRIYNFTSKNGDHPKYVLAQKETDVRIVPGNNYTLTLECIGNSVTVMVSTDNGSNDSLKFDTTDAKIGHPGRCWDYPRLYSIRGEIELISFQYCTRYHESPELLIIGDSIVEGDSLCSEVTNSSSARFAWLIVNKIASGAILGTAGEQATHFSDDKLTMLRLIFHSPRYALLQHMTNDTTFEKWRDATERIITTLNGMGTQPIIGFMPARLGRENMYRHILGYIAKNGYKCIRFDRALTLNGEGIERDPSLFLPDGLHPNSEGHYNMFLQAITDAPYLFG
jgi:lysophospholipase L1-like esterase